ncbi:DUF1800 family protein [Haloferula sp.]|uniref:DUF1800 family protein n=1 Tax=Haloferula sp. TaxID=2497595 RepID=UPI003C76C851
MALHSASAIAPGDLDTDSDKLADTWEFKHFGGLSHIDGAASADPDGDGRNNYAESEANTDPNDRDDCFEMVAFTFKPNEAIFTWSSSFAKKYSFHISNDLSEWTEVEGEADEALVLRGTGGKLTADFSDPAKPLVTGAATRHIWKGLAEIPENLDAHFSALMEDDADGDGTQWQPQLNTAEEDGEAYSSRFSGYLTPPASGDFSFELSSRGPSVFRLFADENPDKMIAECVVSDSGILEAGAIVDPAQTALGIALVSGQRYRFESLHVHESGLSHFGVKWSGPDLGRSPVPVEGAHLSPAESFASHNAAALFSDGATKFGRVQVHGPMSGGDFDSDGDGIDDATESDEALAAFGFDPFNANGTGSGNDGDRLVELLAFDPATDKEMVVALALDDQAVELLDPPLIPGNIVDLGALGTQTGTSSDKIRFRLARSKGLHPVTVAYDLAGATVGDGTEASAEIGIDFTAIEMPGAQNADGTVTIPAGRGSVEIEVTVMKDNIHEYPETVSCTIVAGSPDYDPAPGSALAKAEIVDMPSDVNILFVGAYEEDFNAVPGSTSANGSVSGYLRGDKRNFILRNDNFANLSTPQVDTHFHKEIDAETGTPPIHDIVESPGEALLGHFLTYDWDLTKTQAVTPIPATGGPSRQTIIDSFFNQNGQTRIYVNLHTDDNAAGEVMAFLEPATGSIDPPTPPDEPAPLAKLEGDALEREIVRFLNQATFGAAWEEVEAIRDAIETERTTGGNPEYHRTEEFAKWIEEQCKMQQTFLLDYNLAADFMEFNLRGLWDADEWNDWTTGQPDGHADGLPDVESVPASWPYIDRSLTNGPAPGMPSSHPHFWANQWYPVGRFPTDTDWIGWMDDDPGKVKRDLGNNGPRERNRRRASWMMMINAKDQLRHKWGFAIQQILVVSDNLGSIRDRQYAASNYMDMLNYYGLPSDRDGSGSLESNEQVYFRDLLGWVNWSPVMGNWLSSIKNRAAYDTDGDGVIDVFPDENLAREDMQLFSIGLFNMWTDGSLRLQTAGDPNTPPGASSTYTNDDIQEFARILTGQNVSRRTYNNRSAIDGWNNQGFREGSYGWGIEDSGPFADAGEVFDTINDHGDGDQQDGDDGIGYNTSFTWGSGNRWVGHEWNYPMRMFGYETVRGVRIPYHDLGVKTIAGGRVIDNTGLLVPEGDSFTDQSMIDMGVADIEAAMDWFGGKVDGDASSDFSGAAGDAASSHASTPPFIARRLIQRMVTSNPSSAYLYRVSEAFKASEGNMLEVCKAVLLDPEARNPEFVEGRDLNGDGDFSGPGEMPPSHSFGMKKPPMEAFIQLLRTFEAHSLLPLKEDPTLPPFSLEPFNGSWPTVDGGYDPGTYAVSPFADANEIPYIAEYGYPAHQADNFRLNCLFQIGDTSSNLSMSPFSQETVFNFYLPDFTTGIVQAAALVAPELQLATETEVVSNHNYIWDYVWDWDTSRNNRTDGEDVEELGGSSRNQREAFGLTVPANNSQGTDVDHHDRIRIDFERWAEMLYAEGMVDAEGRSASSLEAEDLIDKLDHRMTAGLLKARYPYDESDDEDPEKDGISPRAPFADDGDLMNDLNDARNPREWIIHAVADSYGDGDTPAERRDKFRLALYLMSQCPEFLVKK